MIATVLASLVLWRQQYPLIDSLRERLQTAEAVARAKHNSGQPVEDKPRERAVIFNAVHQGVNMGLDADRVEQVFAAQIEASKMAQRAFLKQWQSEPKFANVPDLAKTVRPTLDRLTPLILQGLKAHRPWPKNAASLGPHDSAYREAWIEAISPFASPANRRL